MLRLPQSTPGAGSAHVSLTGPSSESGYPLAPDLHSLGRPTSSPSTTLALSGGTGFRPFQSSSDLCWTPTLLFRHPGFAPQFDGGSLSTPSCDRFHGRRYSVVEADDTLAADAVNANFAFSCTTAITFRFWSHRTERTADSGFHLDESTARTHDAAHADENHTTNPDRRKSTTRTLRKAWNQRSARV